MAPQPLGQCLSIGVPGGIGRYRGIEGVDKTGHVIGSIQPTVLRPLFTPKLEAAGFKLPAEIFLPTRGRR